MTLRLLITVAMGALCGAVIAKFAYEAAPRAQCLICGTEDAATRCAHCNDRLIKYAFENGKQQARERDREPEPEPQAAETAPIIGAPAEVPAE